MEGERVVPYHIISFTYQVIGICVVYSSALKVPIEVVKVAIDMVDGWY